MPNSLRAGLLLTNFRLFKSILQLISCNGSSKQVRDSAYLPRTPSTACVVRATTLRLSLWAVLTILKFHILTISSRTIVRYQEVARMQSIHRHNIERQQHPYPTRRHAVWRILECCHRGSNWSTATSDAFDPLK